MPDTQLNNANHIRSKIIHEVMEGVEWEVGEFVKVCLDVAQDCCESPIEVAFLAGYLAINESSAPFKVQRFQTVVHLDSGDDLDAITARHEAFDAPLMDGRVFHYIQSQVQLGRYRVDFLVKSVLCINKPSKEQVVHSRKVVIECDGHEFHERTAEQAERDKSRDRELVAMGFTVMRYTGREIWRDPTASANEVAELLRNDIVSKVKAGSRDA